MKLNQVIAALCAAALGASLPAPGGAQAQSYPSRPIKVVVGFPPGQATDVIARLMAAKLAESLGQPVVVENRPGKGGSLGAEAVAKSPPDGYTLLVSATAPLATNFNLYPSVGYNPATDFAPISLMAWLPFVLIVNPSVPANTLAELIAYAKTRPGALSYASSGNGTTAHLTMEMLKKATGIDILHVPYKGGVAALSDVMAGQLQMGWDTAMFVLPHVKAGKVRAIATASPTRSPLMPDIPAAAETVPGFSSGAWLGLVAPAGTPRDIVNRLNAELHKLMKTPELAEKLAGLGSEVLLSTPDEFHEHIRRELVKWGKAVKDSGTRLD